MRLHHLVLFLSSLLLASFAFASDRSTRRVTQVSNRSPHFVELYWVDPETREAIQKDVTAPGNQYGVSTFVGHTFEVRQGITACRKGPGDEECESSPDPTRRRRIRQFTISERPKHYYFVTGQDMELVSRDTIGRIRSDGMLLQKSRRFVCQAPISSTDRVFLLQDGGCALLQLQNKPELCSYYKDALSWSFTPYHSSPVATYLTPELYSELSGRRTTLGGYTIDDLIVRGVEEEVVTVGIVAADEECYDVFPEIFLPILHKFHYASDNPGELSAATTSPPRGPVYHCDENNVTPLAIDGDRVLSFRIRAARNIQGHDFIPYMSVRQRQELSETIRAAVTDDASMLSMLNTTISPTDDDFYYYDIAELSANEISRLVEQNLWRQAPVTPNLLFGYDGDTVTWPIGRALWLSRNNNNGDEEESTGVCHLLSWLFLWINEEDHLRVVALESSLNHSLDGVLERWQSFMVSTQQALAKHGHGFEHHNKFGYLSTCPTNIGTGMRISVRLCLPSLLLDDIHTIARKYHLEVRSEREQQQTVGSRKHNDKRRVHQVSNQQRWGLTEYEIYAIVTRGVQALLAADDQLLFLPHTPGL